MRGLQVEDRWTCRPRLLDVSLGAPRLRGLQGRTTWRIRPAAVGFIGSAPVEGTASGDQAMGWLVKNAVSLGAPRLRGLQEVRARNGHQHGIEVSLGAPRLRGLQGSMSSRPATRSAVSLGAPRLRGLQGIAASVPLDITHGFIGSAPVEGTARGGSMSREDGTFEFHWERPG